MVFAWKKQKKSRYIPRRIIVYPSFLTLRSLAKIIKLDGVLDFKFLISLQLSSQKILMFVFNISKKLSSEHAHIIEYVACKVAGYKLQLILN